MVLSSGVDGVPVVDRVVGWPAVTAAGVVPVVIGAEVLSGRVLVVDEDGWWVVRSSGVDGVPVVDRVGGWPAVTAAGVVPVVIGAEVLSG